MPSGRYLYDPAAHSLSNRTSGSSGKAAFILDYERERDFDAGVSYMFALLGSVSMWNGTGSQLASFPKQEYLYFGNNSVADVIEYLKYTNNFTKKDISLNDLSQLLWAGYGNTPHRSYNGRGGLTVPSWYADDIDKWYARLEAGFVAGTMLLQGSAMGVGCWFTTGLRDDERDEMRKVVGFEGDDMLFTIVSVGISK